MNQALALQVIETLFDAGVEEFCVCPGARNSPLVDLLLKIPFVKRHHFFEERAATFFALGRMKSDGKPVAVVTTSGTAAGELFPGTMEAYYSALPLVLLTADRPRRFRKTGAPQTAEQVGLFGIYAESCLDIAAGELVSIGSWSRLKPIHLNVCFEEPLLDASGEKELSRFVARRGSPQSAAPASVAEDIRSDKISAFLQGLKHPLVIVGSLHRNDRAEVKRFLQALQAPTYFEAHSGLREDRDLLKLRVHNADRLLERAKEQGYEIDGVFRIGGVPTHRLWRDLEVLNGKIPVESVSREPFSGLSFASVTAAPPSQVLKNLRPAPVKNGASDFLAQDHSLQEKVRALFHQEPRSEAALFHQLSRAIPADARIFIGNSLPIREWDLAATFAQRNFEIGASRGLNGIDGQVSTFLGFAQPRKENWGIIGDLTALYDLQGPWALSLLPPELKTSLVVINNRGGKIFSRMFGPKEFQNPHSIEFSAWAKLWKLTYEEWHAVPDTGMQTQEHRIIELIPDEAATQRFWSAYQALISSRQS